MPDINQMIRDQAAHDPDVVDRMQDIEDWDREKAATMAAEENIQLEAEHWEVITFIREHYAQHGRAKSGRELSDLLDERFSQQGGRKHLYRLFPDGPVSQGSRIAGVPLPKYAEDDSFGYSQ